MDHVVPEEEPRGSEEVARNAQREADERRAGQEVHARRRHAADAVPDVLREGEHRRCGRRTLEIGGGDYKRK